MLGLLKIMLVVVMCVFSLQGRAEPIDFVIDIDGVLLYEGTPQALAGAAPSQVVSTSYGYRYRIANGAPEFLQSLAAIPDSRITFFSGGSRTRNEQVLKQLRLPDGRTAWEVAYRTFSDVDRTPPRLQELRDQRPALRTLFWGELKKDLRIVPDIDLNRAVLIDDRKSYVAPGQEKNYLLLDYDFVSPGYEREAYPVDASDRVRKLEQSQGEWGAMSAAARNMAHRNKLIYARGILERARQLSENEGISLVDALWRVQWQEIFDNPISVRHTHPWSRQIYELGLASLKSENPNFQFSQTYHPISVTRPPHCSQMFEMIAVL